MECSCKSRHAEPRIGKFVYSDACLLRSRVLLDCRLNDWNFNPEYRSISRFALYGDRSLVQLDDPLRDGQTQAGATERAAAGFIDAVEALEDPRLILRSNSNPRIFHAHDGATAFLFG